MLSEILVDVIIEGFIITSAAIENSFDGLKIHHALEGGHLLKYSDGILQVCHLDHCFQQIPR